MFSALDIPFPPFWKIAADKQKKAAIVNMPLTYPPQPFANGCLVTSFLTPPKAHFAFPPSLEKELKKIGYKTNIEFEHYFFARNGKLTKEEKNTILQDVFQFIKKREQVGKAIIKKKEWDVFFLLFKNTDLIQHLFWKGKQTTAVYQRVDEAISHLVSFYKRKNPHRPVTIFIVSDHGFHPVAKKDIALYPLFSRLKVLPTLRKTWLKLLRGFRKLTGFSWISSLAYPGCQVKITPFGITLPNASLKKAKKLKDKLERLRVCGKKVFREIKILQESKKTFQLLWITNPYFAPNADPLSGKLTYPRKSHFKARHHSDRKGIFIISGAYVKAKGKRKPLNIYDIPVNILGLLGINPPSYMEGKLNRKIFSLPLFLKKSSLQVSKKSFSKEKKEKILIRRLKALGYLQ